MYNIAMKIVTKSISVSKLKKIPNRVFASKKMSTFHSDLHTNWKSYSIYEQMANIGAEVGRSINWKTKNNSKMSLNAFYRALELIDFTIDDSKNINRLSEILRMREILVDFSIGENIYNSSEVEWNKYFFHYNFAARNH